MANRVLPSREQAALSQELWDNEKDDMGEVGWALNPDTEAVLNAYTSGRLVDREVPANYDFISAWFDELTPNEGRDVAKRLAERAEDAARAVWAGLGISDG